MAKKTASSKAPTAQKVTRARTTNRQAPAPAGHAADAVKARPPSVRTANAAAKSAHERGVIKTVLGGRSS